jgi:general secretion pathway protein H
MTSNCSPTDARRTRGGFTIFELLVVLFIISVLTALLVPRVGTGFRTIQEREFVQDFVETLRRARLIAMNSGEPVPFRINGNERRYGIEYPLGRPIPENVDVYADRLERDPDTGDFVILFFPDGSLSGGDVELNFDHKKGYLVHIHPLFGTVEVEKVDGR